MPLYFSELSSSLFSYFFEGVFIGENQEKLGGGVVYLPLEKTKTETSLFFEFWGRRFKLAKFHRNR